MASITLTRGNTLPDSSAKADFHNLVDLASASITNIEDADVSNSAAIAASKLNLATVAQDIAMSGKVINFAKGSDIASATTTDIGASTGNFIDVTGTTTITGLGTVQAGTIRFVRFTGILTLTHNGTSLILPTTANITTAANDRAIFASLGSGNWICLAYQRADGTALSSSSPSAASQAEQEAASSTIVYTTPGRQQFHPSAPKAWAQFDGTATGTNAPTAGYNVTSITRNSQGNYTINLATGFSGTGICLLGSGSSGGSEALIVGMITAHATAPVIETTNGGGTSQDGALICFAIWGDQS